MSSSGASDPTCGPSAYQKAALAALREMTGQDTAPAAEPGTAPRPAPAHDPRPRGRQGISLLQGPVSQLRLGRAWSSISPRCAEAAAVLRIAASMDRIWLFVEARPLILQGRAPTLRHLPAVDPGAFPKQTLLPTSSNGSCFHSYQSLQSPLAVEPRAHSAAFPGGSLPHDRQRTAAGSRGHSVPLPFQARPVSGAPSFWPSPP